MTRQGPHTLGKDVEPQRGLCWQRGLGSDARWPNGGGQIISPSLFLQPQNGNSPYVTRMVGESSEIMHVILTCTQHPTKVPPTSRAAGLSSLFLFVFLSPIPSAGLRPLPGFFPGLPASRPAPPIPRSLPLPKASLLPSLHSQPSTLFSGSPSTQNITQNIPSLLRLTFPGCCCLACVLLLRLTSHRQVNPWSARAASGLSASVYSAPSARSDAPSLSPWPPPPPEDVQ